MDVRFERVRDQDTEPRGGVEVRLEVTIGVHEERDALVWIGDEVGGVAEARVEELIEQHRGEC